MRLNFSQYKMTQYNSLNVKLSNSQLNKFKSAIKKETEVVLRLSSNMIGDDEINFPDKLLLTNRYVSILRKAFAIYLSTDIKLSKSQLSRMVQSGGFLGRFLGPLLKTGLPLIKNVIKPLAKSVLIPLGLTAAASVADAGIHLKILGSDLHHSCSASHNHPSSATLIISNDEMGGIIKIVKSLEDSGLLLKGVTETVQNEITEQKGGFLSMLLGTLAMEIIKKEKKQQKGFLMPPHPLTNFDIQKYYQNEPSLNGIYSRDNLPKRKD